MGTGLRKRHSMLLDSIAASILEGFACNCEYYGPVHIREPEGIMCHLV